MTRFVKSVVAGATLLAAGAAFVPTAAQAQGVTTIPVQKPFALKLGVAFPSEGGGGGQFAVGASYDFSKSTSTSPTLFQVYLDYYGESAQNVIGGGVAGKFLLAPATAGQGQPFAGLGLGIYTNKVGGSSNKTNFGGKVFAGYQLNSGVFGEVDYTLVQENNNVNPSAFGVKVGYRF
jgi:hypothetical protein